MVRKILLNAWSSPINKDQIVHTQFWTQGEERGSNKGTETARKPKNTSKLAVRRAPRWPWGFLCNGGTGSRLCGRSCRRRQAGPLSTPSSGTLGTSASSHQTSMPSLSLSLSTATGLSLSLSISRRQQEMGTNSKGIFLYRCTDDERDQHRDLSARGFGLGLFFGRITAQRRTITGATRKCTSFSVWEDGWVIAAFRALR